MSQPTAALPLGSELVRKKWVREGLIQSASKSFWNPVTGTSKNSIVYQCNNESADAGHTVVFDFSGNISGKVVKGKDTAFGKGEEKLKFSDKLTVERYRIPVDNGDKFDGVNIGDLNITQHSDSRAKLADLFVRFKDQSLFDAAQGNLGQAPSHTIALNALDYNNLLDIETTLKTSTGFSSGGMRRPLEPFITSEGRPMWLFVCDAASLKKLKQSSNYQAIVSNADVRGNDNRLIKGVVGRLGNLVIVEADSFFGNTAGTARGWDLAASSIEIAGLRQYNGASAATAPWSGQTGFEASGANLTSRNLILGAGALQLGFGKMPDYKFQESTDFGITSESALEVWMETRKTHLKAETSDYKQAKVAGIDYGVVAVDVKVGA